MDTGTDARPIIYRSRDAARHVLALYDSFVARWPVPVIESDLDTDRGTVHVLEWGPADGAPLLLCHAASMAATSWLPNAASLADAGYRCHAVDYIGEAGKSRLTDRCVHPKSGAELGGLYASILASLGITSAPVVAASAGGHVALRLALAAPERVSHLALLGPMGITPPGVGTLLRMMVASLVPRPSVAARTSHWALGTAPAVTDEYGGWFSAALESLESVASPPRVARPVALSTEEFGRIEAPVLLVLGDRDDLVGEPDRAARSAAALPDVRIEVLSSGHLVGVEQAGEVNSLLTHFHLSGRLRRGQGGVKRD